MTSDQSEHWNKNSGIHPDSDRDRPPAPGGLKPGAEWTGTYFDGNTLSVPGWREEGEEAGRPLGGQRGRSA